MVPLPRETMRNIESRDTCRSANRRLDCIKYKTNKKIMKHQLFTNASNCIDTYRLSYLNNNHLGFEFNNLTLWICIDATLEATNNSIINSNRYRIRFDINLYPPLSFSKDLDQYLHVFSDTLSWTGFNKPIVCKPAL